MIIITNFGRKTNLKLEIDTGIDRKGHFKVVIKRKPENRIIEAKF